MKKVLSFTVTGFMLLCIVPLANVYASSPPVISFDAGHTYIHELSMELDIPAYQESASFSGRDDLSVLMIARGGAHSHPHPEEEIDERRHRRRRPIYVDGDDDDDYEEDEDDDEDDDDDDEEEEW